MQLATHELAKSGSKPAAVAQAMGYGSEAAFSRALSAVGLTQADLATSPSGPSDGPGSRLGSTDTPLLVAVGEKSPYAARRERGWSRVDTALVTMAGKDVVTERADEVGDLIEQRLC